MLSLNRKNGYIIIASLVVGYSLFLGHLFTVSAHHATDWDNNETTIKITVASNLPGGFCLIQVTVSRGGQNQTQTHRIYVPPFGEATICFSFQTPADEPLQYNVIWRSWQSSGEVTGPD